METPVPQKRRQLPELAARLIEAAIAGGGRDNVTAVLGRYHGA